MCPDPQILSIYMDGELPSPWKEKLEIHLAECSVCGEKLKNLNQLRELFKKDENLILADSYVNEAKEKIWTKLENASHFRRHRQVRPYNVWQRKLSIPLPVAAAAAAVVIIFMLALGISGGFNNRNVQPSEFAAVNHLENFLDRPNIILAAEEEMPGIMPIADLNSVLQLLDSGGTDILIMRLPESKSFLKSGEPAIIRAADYSRRHP